MKKSSISIILLAAALAPLYASAASDAFSAYEAHATLGRDSSLEVRERFIFDFGAAAKHGIVREIPLYTTPTQKHPFGFTFRSIVDDKGEEYGALVSPGGNVATIKIGSQELLLTGTHYYDLRYLLSNAGSERSVTWDVVPPMKENVEKMRGDLFLPLPLPMNMASATCALVQAVDSVPCAVTALTQNGLLYGFRVEHENLGGHGVTLTVNYPPGFVHVAASSERERTIPPKVLIALFVLALLVILALIAYRYRVHIREWRAQHKKRVVFPDAYSYLARAQAGRGGIGHDDVVATIADLVARGYLSLSPLPNPVGEFEFVDYEITVLVPGTLDGAEGALIDAIEDSGGISSLDAWLRTEFPKLRPTIMDVARSEVDTVILLSSDEIPPELPGFRFKS